MNVFGFDCPELFDSTVPEVCVVKSSFWFSLVPFPFEPNTQPKPVRRKERQVRKSLCRSTQATVGQYAVTNQNHNQESKHERFRILDVERAHTQSQRVFGLLELLLDAQLAAVTALLLAAVLGAGVQAGIASERNTQKTS